MNVANALAAAAAAWSVGAHLHDIRQGLRTFSTSFFQAPGRLNLLEIDGMRVMIDYCHNVDGMRQLTDFVERMMVDGPRPKAAVRVGPAGGVLQPSEQNAASVRSAIRDLPQRRRAYGSL